VDGREVTSVDNQPGAPDTGRSARRVLVVSTWFPSDDQPGIAPFNVAHAKAIARHHEIRVVHARLGAGGPELVDTHGGLTIVRLPFGPRHPAAAAGSLVTLRRLCADVDVVHSMAFSTLGVLAPLYPLIGGRWVHTEHWNGVTDPKRVGGVWERVAAARHLLRLPRRVSAVTDDLATAMARFARRGAMRVIPCVVDDSFSVGEQLPWAPLKLVAVGALTDRKRPLLAVDTVAALVARGVDVHLTWVGDGALRDQVSRSAADLGVRERVHLVGAVPPDRVAEHVRAANLFFLPTAAENFLTSAAEAIACGRPVVLPDAGGYTDYVDARNGVIAKADDPATLAEAVLQAREAFTGVPPETIRATVSTRFSEETVAGQFTELYSR
jgi:glycosyltransferase involved in cell wall biosynthesis